MFLQIYGSSFSDNVNVGGNDLINRSNFDAIVETYTLSSNWRFHECTLAGVFFLSCFGITGLRNMVLYGFYII